MDHVVDRQASERALEYDERKEWRRSSGAWRHLAHTLSPAIVRRGRGGSDGTLRIAMIGWGPDQGVADSWKRNNEPSRGGLYYIWLRRRTANTYFYRGSSRGRHQHQHATCDPDKMTTTTPYHPNIALGPSHIPRARTPLALCCFPPWAMISSSLPIVP